MRLTRAGGILRLAVGEAEPPAIIVDHDRDMIRIVKGRGGSGEFCFVELPLRRGELPDQLVEVDTFCGSGKLSRKITGRSSCI